MTLLLGVRARDLTHHLSKHHQRNHLYNLVIVICPLAALVRSFVRFLLVVGVA